MGASTMEDMPEAAVLSSAAQPTLGFAKRTRGTPAAWSANPGAARQTLTGVAYVQREPLSFRNHIGTAVGRHANNATNSPSGTTQQTLRQATNFERKVLQLGQPVPY